MKAFSFVVSALLFCCESAFVLLFQTFCFVVEAFSFVVSDLLLCCESVLVLLQKGKRFAVKGS